MSLKCDKKSGERKIGRYCLSGLRPFGELSCELEIKKLQKKYVEFFFADAPFNNSALAEDCYLIIGRRGSGKTSLANYFTFQEAIPNATGIDVNEPDMYSHAMQRVGEYAATSTEIAIPRMVTIWEFLIWNVIFDHCKENHPDIKKACRVLDSARTGTASRLLKNLFNDVISKFLGKGSTFIPELED